MDELKVRMVEKRQNERTLDDLTGKSNEIMIKTLQYYSETLTYEEATFLATLRELNVEDYTYALKLIREKYALTVKTKDFLERK